VSDARYLLLLLDATLRRSVAQLSAGNPTELCQEGALPSKWNIAVELQIDAFIPLTWFPLANLFGKREPQTMHLGQPRFWRRFLRRSQKCRLFLHVQIDAGIITNRLLLKRGNGASVNLVENTSMQ